MYQINYYNFPIYDDSLQELFPVLNAQLNLEVNDAGGLSFSIPSRHPNFNDLKKLKLGVTVEKNGRVIFKGRIVKDTQDFDNSKVVECEGKLAVLNDSIYRPYEFAGSPRTYFNDLIANHNSMVEEEKQFKIGNITVTDPNDYITRSSIDYNTTWELMKKLVNGLGGYICIRYEADGDYIDWLEDFPYTNLQKIEFAENLLDITQEVTAENTYTACIPLGANIEIPNYSEVAEDNPIWKADTYYRLSGDTYVLITSETDFNYAMSTNTVIYTISSVETTDERVTVASANNGIDYIYNPDKVAEYGWKFAPADEVTWDDVTSPNNLLTKARAYLNNVGVMLATTLELSAIDLAYTDADITSFEFCQYVQVQSTPHNLEKTYLLSKIDIDMLHPENTKITLGDSQYSLYDAMLGQQQNVDNIVQRVEKIESSYANGADGKSAYQIWLEAGNTGTEADFLASLQGAQGPQGIQGEQGAKGDTGNGVASSTVQYQIAEDGVNVPTGTWENTPQQTTAEKPYLWTKTVVNYTDGTSSDPIYAIGATPEGVEETTEQRMRQEIAQLTTVINQTAEDIVVGVRSGYTSKDELNTYKHEVENMFSANEQGFEFNFNRLEQQLNAVGNEVNTQKEYIRLINGEIHIGKDGNPVTSVYTNNALEFRYNGVTVAKFTNETLEVRNITSENQVAFFGDWAIRKGAEVSGKGYNLNDIWIGG